MPPLGVNDRCAFSTPKVCSRAISRPEIKHAHVVTKVNSMMDFLRQAATALLGGWIIGVAFAWIKLPAPVPPLMGLIGAAGVLIGAY